MVDQEYGNHAKFLRASGLRLDDSATQFVLITHQRPLLIASQARAHVVFVHAGQVCLKTRAGTKTLKQGTTLAVENGHDIELRALGSRDSVEVMVSSIGANYAYIQKLPDGLLQINADEKPYAEMIALVVSALKMECGQDRRNESVCRRLNEVIMLQLIQRVQAAVSASTAPDKVQHDEYLLRAWTAFFADSSKAWSVESLAAEAGLSRSAFFERFYRAFGSSPIKALRTYRLEQAKKLLFSSRAPLLEVAFSVGYSSSAALVRAFKKEFGVTPQVWRNSGASS